MTFLSGFLISAARMSSGKTTISIGLSRAIIRRNIDLQTFKKGPDYIDSNWLSAASGEPCFNLDFNVQNHDEIKTCYQSNKASVCLIEGNKGLFDSIDIQGTQSNAALARLLNVPVVLVIDCQGITRGIAPLLQGYVNFEELNFCGVILNKTGGQRQQAKLLSAVETYTDLKVLGCIERSHNLEISERHLGLNPGSEEIDSEHTINLIADRIEQQVDLENFTAVADMKISWPESRKAVSSNKDLTIAVAKDRAFSFYYQDDLNEMEQQGATLTFFSPLSDTTLPDADALFFGGGFPEIFAKELSSNTVFRRLVKDFVENNGVVYAECGGLMYLANSIGYGGNCFSMVGVFDGDVQLQKKPVGRGLVKMKPTVSHPWCTDADLSKTINAHEFHYSLYTSKTVQASEELGFEIERGYGVDGYYDGLVYRNVLATYVHQRHTIQNPWVRYFVNFIRHKTGK